MHQTRIEQTTRNISYIQGIQRYLCVITAAAQSCCCAAVRQMTVVTFELWNVAEKSPARFSAELSFQSALPPVNSLHRLVSAEGFKDPVTKATAAERPANQRADSCTHPPHASISKHLQPHFRASATSVATHPPTGLLFSLLSNDSRAAKLLTMQRYNVPQ